MESSSKTRRSDCILVIMAKAPKLGMVKTRLEQCLPPPAVLALYRCLLEDTISLARSLRGVEVAIMCPAMDVSDLAYLAGDEVQIVTQKGEGLAAGLTSVFVHFTAGGQRRVIAFNSDTPHLPATVLESAFEALVAHDMVVGPTHDGGYYLIGAKSTFPALFENDGMGTGNAFEALLARARALKLSIVFTDPFYDIDLADDLIRLLAELRVAPAKAPRTAAWLLEWGQTVAQLTTGIGGM